MKKIQKRTIVFGIVVALLTAGSAIVAAAESNLKDHYVGLIPAFLAEPYDDIRAIEVNFAPFLYEVRIGEANDIGFQFRPILNYRFYRDQSGFSQIGGTVVANKYWLNVGGEDPWVIPHLGLYYTYAYNRLDEIQTMTGGIETGGLVYLGNDFSLTLTLQPGINYYPDERSRAFVDAPNGFKGHFGLFVHVGYNF
jgi:hypothetical protein